MFRTGIQAHRKRPATSGRSKSAARAEPCRQNQATRRASTAGPQRRPVDQQRRGGGDPVRNRDLRDFERASEPIAFAAAIEQSPAISDCTDGGAATRPRGSGAAKGIRDHDGRRCSPAIPTMPRGATPPTENLILGQEQHADSDCGNISLVHARICDHEAG